MAPPSSPHRGGPPRTWPPTWSSTGPGTAPAAGPTSSCSPWSASLPTTRSPPPASTMTPSRKPTGPGGSCGGRSFRTAEPSRPLAGGFRLIGNHLAGADPPLFHHELPHVGGRAGQRGERRGAPEGDPHPPPLPRPLPPPFPPPRSAPPRP